MQFLNKWPTLGVGLLSFLLASLRFFPFYLGKTLYFGDNYSLMVPGKIFTAHWIQQGILPLWNPDLFSGLPWLADINQSVLYFSTLFFIWLQPTIGLNVTIFVHYVLAGMGMWLLAKQFVKKNWQALLAVILWVFSTQLAGSTNNLSTLQSLVWLPWLAYLGLNVQRGFFAKFSFAVVVLLQFLGGYPQHVIYSIFFAVLLSFYNLIGSKSWQKDIISWLFDWMKTGLLTLLISAVAWLPFAEVFLKSTRISQSLEQAQVGSLHPAMLIKPLLPYFYDLQLVGMKWGPAWNGQPNVVFVITGFGLLVIGASLLQWNKLDRWVKFFAIFTLFSLIFSMGKYLPYFSVVQQLIPLFRIGRYPSMVMILTNVVVILWFVRYLPKFRLAKTWQSTLLISLLAATIISVLVIGVAKWEMDDLWVLLNIVTRSKLETSVFHNLARDQIIILVIASNLFWTSLLTMINLVFWRRKKIIALPIVIACEMWLATQGMFFFANNDVYPSWQELNEGSGLASQVTPMYRVLTRNSNNPYTDYGSYWEALVVRAPFSDSFIDEQELRDQATLKRLRMGLTPDWNIAYGVPVVNGYTTLLPRDYAAIWQSSAENRINFVDYIDIANPHLSEWSVKYYLVDNWYPDIPDLSSYQELSTDGDLTLFELPNALARFRYSSDNSPVEFDVFAENPNQLNLSFTSEHSDKIVIADRYDTNWRAELNGQPVEIDDSNGMRSIDIQPGENKLELMYVPIYFYSGLAITLITLLIGSTLSWKFDKLRFSTQH